MRATSHGQPFAIMSSAGGNPNPVALRASVTPSGVFGDGSKARKGSIRSAVRKIFGRRSRDSMGPIMSADAETYAFALGPRHAYHKSEPPPPLSPPRELSEPSHVADDNNDNDHDKDNDELGVRIPSTSYYPPERPSFSRTTSPYALQFPNSVRLKPMDLSNHFASPPTVLKRRKTLPSLLQEQGGTTADGQPSEPITHTEPVPSLGKAGEEGASKSRADKVRKDRRKSRSVDDLQASTTREQSVPRKRSEEIRFWRDGQSRSRDRAAAIGRPDVSREGERPTTVYEQETHPGASALLSAPHDVPSKPATLKSSPPHPRGAGTSFNDDFLRPSSGVGTDMSRDLEDRVAKLEAGLHSFQQSLQKLTADRNRRTIVMGGGIATRSNSGEERRPSLLADTLADALEPSSYEYEYGHTIRPSASPQPPLPAAIQGRIEDPFGPDLPVPASSATRAGPRNSHALTSSRSADLRLEPERPPTPHTTSATMAAVTPGTNGSNGAAQPQQYTFRSLYEMLADERSARRKLENQLKTLRQEITDLHTQVNSSSSNIQSMRSSYMLAGTSSRLQDLLRETGEASPPDASPRSLKRNSGQSTGYAHAISRFSGSDSEAMTQDFSQEYEDLGTPYTAYRTPREERSKWSLKLDVDNKDADVF